MRAFTTATRRRGDVSPLTRRTRGGSHRAGFVLLTEAVIALTVMLIGILAASVIFARSHETEARAVIENRAATFADSTLNALRGADSEWAANGTWSRSWEDFRDGQTNVRAAAYEMWANYTSLVIQAGLSNQLDFLVYDHRTGEERATVDHQMAYGLLIVMETNHWPDVDRATATLSVWPDRYTRQPFVFYTEFFNTDGM